jgi:DNA polymerase elongation subunit (family B)
MKIVTLDLETAPNTSYTWGKYDQNVIAFLKEGYLLSFAYKWFDEKTTHVIGLCDMKGYKKDLSDDKELTKALWKIFDEADVIIAYNGRKFDIRKANARFAIHGLPPPSPYKVIDPLPTVRRVFKFESNKLDDIGEYLGLGRKIETGGFKLWLGCMNNDTPSWNKMKKYNKQDVVLLEKVYQTIRKWDDKHMKLHFDNLCGVCGSSDVQWRGEYRTTQKKRGKRFQCKLCQSWGIKMI